MESRGWRTLVDVGKNTALGDGDVSEKLVQLLIIANGELQMAGDDTGLLIVTGGIASEFKDFGSEVFQHSSKVDGSTWQCLECKWLEKAASVTHQHQRAGRSCLFSTGGGHGQRGMQDRLWMSDWRR